jgi:hypothetical protein
LWEDVTARVGTLVTRILVNVQDCVIGTRPAHDGGGVRLHVVLVPLGLARHIESIGWAVFTTALLADSPVRNVDEPSHLPVAAALGNTLGEI